MLIRRQLRGIDLADDPILVDDISHSTGDYSKSLRDGKQFPQRSIGITDQWECEPVLFGEAEV